MTFLPIVERELRVASRRRSTAWSRVMSAGFALVIFLFLQAVILASKGSGGPSGSDQFQVMIWMVFVFACFAGLTLTADSLSEEKREGTLGLLFLTDLKGYDVAVGKLISCSIVACYGLVATVPIIALTFFAGGVTWTEFGRCVAVIGSTLFLSLGLGMFASSLCRDALKSLSLTLLMFAVIAGGFPLVDLLLAGGDPAKFVARLSMASPVYLFVRLGGMSPGQFMAGFWMQLGAGLFVILSASIITPLTWQEKNPGIRASMIGRSAAKDSPVRRHAQSAMRGVLDSDPVLWLGIRNRWLPRIMWALAIVAVGFHAAAYSRRENYALLSMASSVSGLAHLAVMVWVAALSARFFGDGIRTGALELLLVTQMTPERIVKGQWRGFLRIFLMPCLVMLLAGMISSFLAVYITTKSNTATSPAVLGFDPMMYQVVTLAVSIVNYFGDLAALAWVGMWMGLTSPKNSTAVVKTLVFVVVLPWIGLVFLQVLTFGVLAFARTMFWMAPILMCVGDLIKNLMFIRWSRNKLMGQFRDVVAQTSVKAEMRKQFLPPPMASAQPVNSNPA